MSVEDVQDTVITASLLCAAAAIDSAALTAQAVIMKALSNNCAILIDLYNGTTDKVESKALKNIVVNYVQSMASKYSDKEYTIKIDKGVASWVKRDLAVLARENLKAEIEALQTPFSAYKSYDLKGFDIVQAMPKTSEADLKRVKSTIELSIVLASLLDTNESLLTATDKMGDIVQMFAIDSTMTVHELNQRLTMVKTIVKGAELLKKELDAAKNAYKAACNQLHKESLDASGLTVVKDAILKHTPLSLSTLLTTTECVNLLHFTCKTAVLVGHTFDTTGFNASSIADIVLVLTGFRDTVNAIAESAAKIEAVKEEQAQVIETLKEEQAEVLATIKDSVLIADAEQKELDRLADLASDCENAGLTPAYNHYISLPNGAVKATYNAQLGRMLAFYDQDDVTKQDKVFKVYNSLVLTDLPTLQAGYAKAVESLATAPKDRLLTSFDTIFNKDTNEAAAKLRQALHVIIPDIIAGKETNDRNVIICLMQQLARELELSDKKTETKVVEVVDETVITDEQLEKDADNAARLAVAKKKKAA
jgi:hypothetical protein